MTVVVTTNVPARFRGFLASCMLELAPGVYTAPRMSRAVRERVLAVLTDWHDAENIGSVLMTWADKTAPGGQGIATLGIPPVELVEFEGMIVLRHPPKREPATPPGFPTPEEA
jgi:CRISPR-associated protein Cas2